MAPPRHSPPSSLLLLSILVLLISPLDLYGGLSATTSGGGAGLLSLLRPSSAIRLATAQTIPPAQIAALQSLNPAITPSCTDTSTAEILTCDFLGNVLGLHGVSATAGALPSSISALSALTSLDLSSAGLTGFLPSTLSSLTGLVNLNLCSNSLSGSFPAALTSLTNLQYLSLELNQFSGPLHDGISALVNLQTLNVMNSGFSGILPPSIGNLVKLTKFEVLGMNALCPENRSPCEVPQSSSTDFCNFCSDFCSSCVDQPPFGAPPPPTQSVAPPPPPPLSSPPPPLSSPPPPLSSPPPPRPPPPSSSSSSSGGGSSSPSVALIVGVVVVAVLLLLVAAALTALYFYRRRKSNSSYADDDKRPMYPPSPLPLYSTPRSPSTASIPPSPSPSSCTHFSLSQLQQATDGWSDANLLGTGGFGTVYKGRDPLNPSTVWAVKRAKVQSHEFTKEVEVAAELRHPNVVRLIGYCNEYSPEQNAMEQILVFELVPNGDLQAFLDKDAGVGLEVRLKILHGVASGLQYLHSYRYVHRDIKPHNVLLGSDWGAKIADFGLVRVMEGMTVQSTRVMGTPGYIDPAYMQTHFATPSVDVYCFGVLMLHTITSFKRTGAAWEHVTNWARPLHQAGNASALKHYAVEAPDDTFLRLVDLALSCVAVPTSIRPSMADVVAALDEVRKEVFGAVISRTNQMVDERLQGRNGSLTMSLSQELANVSASEQSTCSALSVTFDSLDSV